MLLTYTLPSMTIRAKRLLDSAHTDTQVKQSTSTGHDRFLRLWLCIRETAHYGVRLSSPAADLTVGVRKFVFEGSFCSAIGCTVRGYFITSTVAVEIFIESTQEGAYMMPDTTVT